MRYATLSLVLVYAGDYALAKVNAERALRLFQAVEYRLGQGLALRNLAEALRRSVTRDDDPAERLQILREARDYAHAAYFDPWNRDGTFVKMNDMLRKPARQALNRDPEPSISVLDSPSVTTAEAGEARGDDGKKRSMGANGTAGLIQMGSCCACSSIRRHF